MRPWIRAVGVILVLLAIVGFLTVADDLRHKDELLQVSSVLTAGLALVALSFRRARQ